VIGTLGLAQRGGGCSAAPAAVPGTDSGSIAESLPLRRDSRTPKVSAGRKFGLETEARIEYDLSVGKNTCRFIFSGVKLARHRIGSIRTSDR